jgi:hypothetical protein
MLQNLSAWVRFIAVTFRIINKSPIASYRGRGEPLARRVTNSHVAWTKNVVHFR